MADIVLTVGLDTRPFQAQLEAALRRLHLQPISIGFSGLGAGIKSGIEQPLHSAAQAGDRLSRSLKQMPLGRITGDLTRFQDALNASNSRVIAFGLSVGIISAFPAAFMKSVIAAKDFEKSLVDINSILRISDDKLKSFGSSLFSSASQFGTSFNEASLAALEFSRQGLGAEETLKRVDAALLLSRLSGTDLASSVQNLTAVLNSFSSEGLSAIEVVDRLAKIDALFAVSSEGLVSALQRVGSTAEDAGISLNQTLALVAAAQERTGRSGSVLGNAFKSIFSRIQRPETIEMLNGLGISTEDANGKLLNTVDLLKQVGSVFDTLDFGQKSRLGEQLGGIFQINVLKATLADLGQQTSRYDQAVLAAQDSSGAAIARNILLNDTFAASWNRLNVSVSKALSGTGAGIISQLSPIVEKLSSSLNAIDAKSFEGIGKVVGGLATSSPAILGTFFILGKMVGQLGVELRKALWSFSEWGIKGSQIKAMLLSQQPILQRINAQNLSIKASAYLVTAEYEKQLAILNQQNARASAITSNAIGLFRTNAQGKEVPNLRSGPGLAIGLLGASMLVDMGLAIRGEVNPALLMFARGLTVTATAFSLWQSKLLLGFGGMATLGLAISKYIENINKLSASELNRIKSQQDSSKDAVTSLDAIGSAASRLKNALDDTSNQNAIQQASKQLGEAINTLSGSDPRLADSLKRAFVASGNNPDSLSAILEKALKEQTSIQDKTARSLAIFKLSESVNLPNAKSIAALIIQDIKDRNPKSLSLIASGQRGIMSGVGDDIATILGGLREVDFQNITSQVKNLANEMLGLEAGTARWIEQTKNSRSALEQVEQAQRILTDTLSQLSNAALDASLSFKSESFGQNLNAISKLNKEMDKLFTKRASFVSENENTSRKTLADWFSKELSGGLTKSKVLTPETRESFAKGIFKESKSIFESGSLSSVMALLDQQIVELTRGETESTNLLRQLQEEKTGQTGKQLLDVNRQMADAQNEIKQSRELKNILSVLRFGFEGQMENEKQANILRRQTFSVQEAVAKSLGAGQGITGLLDKDSIRKTSREIAVAKNDMGSSDPIRRARGAVSMNRLITQISGGEASEAQRRQFANLAFPGATQNIQRQFSLLRNAGFPVTGNPQQAAYIQMLSEFNLGRPIKNPPTSTATGGADILKKSLDGLKGKVESEVRAGFLKGIEEFHLDIKLSPDEGLKRQLLELEGRLKGQVNASAQTSIPPLSSPATFTASKHGWLLENNSTENAIFAVGALGALALKYHALLSASTLGVGGVAAGLLTAGAGIAGGGGVGLGLLVNEYGVNRTERQANQSLALTQGTWSTQTQALLQLSDSIRTWTARMDEIRNAGKETGVFEDKILNLKAAKNELYNSNREGRSPRLSDETIAQLIAAIKNNTSVTTDGKITLDIPNVSQEVMADLKNALIPELTRIIQKSVEDYNAGKNLKLPPAVR